MSSSPRQPPLPPEDSSDSASTLPPESPPAESSLAEDRTLPPVSPSLFEPAQTLPSGSNANQTDHTLAWEMNRPAADQETLPPSVPSSSNAQAHTLDLQGEEVARLEEDPTYQQTGMWGSQDDADFSISAGAGVVFKAPTRGNTTPAPPALPGYEILSELGRGAMGVVYKARQIGLKRLVALKMILQGAHASATDLTRFRTEAEAVARLQHPNIVQVFEIGEHNGLPFFSLEFVEGGCLADRLVENPLPLREAAFIVKQLAEGMACAHAQGIVHRDLKPANVLMTREGTPKITDFGLARKLDEDSSATRAGTIMGTPSYMAPEQAEGRNDRVGPCSDIYSLGAILYDLLTGRPPFRGTTILETLTQVRLIDPVPPARLTPQMPRDLETITLKCLQKDPARRYTSATELADDLRRFLNGEPILARPVSSLERAWKWCKRRPAAAALIAVSMLSVLSLAFGGLAYARSEQRRANEAERLLAIVNQERERAEEHFKQARQAVDQMLLRVGQERLAYEPRMEQVRRDLLEKAATFYDRFLQVDDPSPAVRHEAALASRKLGDIRVLLDEADKAEKAYLRSLELLDPLVQEDPAQSSYREDCAATWNNLGNLLRQGRRLPEAASAYERALQLQQQLVQEAPEDVARRRELALTHYNRGVLEELQGQSRQAVLSYRSALELQRRLVEEEPKNGQLAEELARTWTLLGRLQATSQPDQAQQSLHEALSLLERLVKETPENPSRRQSLLLAANQLGDLLRVSRPNDAGPLFRLAVELGEGLVRSFPTVPEYQQQLAASYNYLAVWDLAAGRRDEATQAFERGLALKEKLASNFPLQADYRRDLARTLGNVGLAFQTANQSARAEGYYRRALELLRKLIKDYPGSSSDEQELALGLVRQASLDPEQAETYLREALRLQEGLLQRDPKSRDYRAERARTCLVLATALQSRAVSQEAESLRQKAEEDFRDLIKRYPEEPEYQLSLATTLLHRGEFARLRQQNKQAEAQWSEAMLLLRGLTRQWPDLPTYPRELARVLHNLGILYTTQKRLADAEKMHLEALTLRQALVEKYPKEPAYRQELASSYAERAIVLTYRNNLKAAEDSFRQALTLLEALHQEYPQDRAYLHDLITQQGNAAQFFQALGRENDAIKTWRARLTAKEALTNLSGANADLRSDLARTYHEFATQLMQLRRSSEACTNFNQAISQQKLALKQAPKKESYRENLRAHYLGLADAHLAEDSHVLASRAIAEAVADAPAKWPQFPVAAALLARCVAATQADNKLEEEKRKEIADRYFQRALDLLRKARQAGFRDLDALRKAKEFEAIRNREEFQKLLQEWES